MDTSPRSKSSPLRCDAERAELLDYLRLAPTASTHPSAGIFSLPSEPAATTPTASTACSQRGDMLSSDEARDVVCHSPPGPRGGRSDESLDCGNDCHRVLEEYDGRASLVQVLPAGETDVVVGETDEDEFVPGPDECRGLRAGMVVYVNAEGDIVSPELRDAMAGLGVLKAVTLVQRPSSSPTSHQDQDHLGDPGGAGHASLSPISEMDAEELQSLLQGLPDRPSSTTRSSGRSSVTSGHADFDVEDHDYWMLGVGAVIELEETVSFDTTITLTPDSLDTSGPPRPVGKEMEVDEKEVPDEQAPEQSNSVGQVPDDKDSDEQAPEQRNSVEQVPDDKDSDEHAPHEKGPTTLDSVDQSAGDVVTETQQVPDDNQSAQCGTAWGPLATSVAVERFREAMFSLSWFPTRRAANKSKQQEQIVPGLSRSPEGSPQCPQVADEDVQRNPPGPPAAVLSQEPPQEGEAPQGNPVPATKCSPGVVESLDHQDEPKVEVAELAREPGQPPEAESQDTTAVVPHDTNLSSKCDDIPPDDVTLYSPTEYEVEGNDQKFVELSGSFENVKIEEENGKNNSSFSKFFQGETKNLSCMLSGESKDVLSGDADLGLLQIQNFTSQSSGIAEREQTYSDSGQGALDESWIVDMEAESLRRFPYYETIADENPPDILLQGDESQIHSKETCELNSLTPLTDIEKLSDSEPNLESGKKTDQSLSSLSSSSTSSSPNRDIDALSLTQCAPLKRRGERLHKQKQSSAKRSRRSWEQWYGQFKTIVQSGRQRLIAQSSSVEEPPKTPLQIVEVDSCVKNPDLESRSESTLSASQKLELLDAQISCSSSQSSKESPECNKENYSSFSNLLTKSTKQSRWPQRPLVEKVINYQQVPDQVPKPKSTCHLNTGVCQPRRLFQWPSVEPSLKETDELCLPLEEEPEDEWATDSQMYPPKQRRPVVRCGLSKRNRPKPLHIRKQWWVLSVLNEACSVQCAEYYRG